jgi:hypothetical protein
MSLNKNNGAKLRINFDLILDRINSVSQNERIKFHDSKTARNNSVQRLDDRKGTLYEMSAPIPQYGRQEIEITVNQ